MPLGMLLLVYFPTCKCSEMSASNKIFSLEIQIQLWQYIPKSKSEPNCFDGTVSPLSLTILDFSTRKKKKSVTKRPLPAVPLLHFLKYLISNLLLFPFPSTILFKIHSSEYLICPYFLFDIFSL